MGPRLCVLAEPLAQVVGGFKGDTQSHADVMRVQDQFKSSARDEVRRSASFNPWPAPDDGSRLRLRGAHDSREHPRCCLERFDEKGGRGVWPWRLDAAPGVAVLVARCQEDRGAKTASTT
jgi:hypothetical protein